MVTKTYLMSIAYDGRDFYGYQYQENLRTVQGEVEKVLEHLYKEKIVTKASGRTDTGVHARDQVISFEARELMPLERLPYVLGRFLPRDIKLNWISYSDIHPRFDALAKSYIYSCSYKDDLFLRPYKLYLKDELDLGAMREAAALLEGKQDFYNFSNRRKEEGSTVREVFRIKIKEKDMGIDMIFVGEGFLYKMVRIMALYLINVGLGKFPAKETSQVLKKKDRLETRQVAPPQALFLDRVFYSQKDLDDYLEKLDI